MVTRKIHNYGAPLCSPKGVLLTNTNISFVIVDTNGRRIDVFDYETQERISGLVTVTTDSNGEFEVDLFPTTRADKTCYYLVHVHNNAFLDFKAALQEGTSHITWFAFKHGGIPITPYEFSLIQYYLDNFIDDLTTNYTQTWSSNKIQSELDKKSDLEHTHTDLHTHDNKVVLDAFGESEGQLLFNGETIRVEVVDDINVTENTTFSSQKILEITTFQYEQITPSNEWNITHTMNKFPNVTVVDSAGTIVFGDIEYVSNTNIIIRFSASFSGKAFLS